jgi:peptidoglycan/LPS O-acetylase OafA/YrhL
MFTHIFLGLGLLIAIISGISNSNSLYIFGGIILVLGVFLWVALQRKFEKDTQKYKTLISGILES